MVCVKVYCKDNSSRYDYHCLSQVVLPYRDSNEFFNNIECCKNTSLDTGFGWYVGNIGKLIFFSKPLIYQG